MSMKLEFLDKFSKYTQISNFLKISPMGPEFVLSEQTDGTSGRHDEASSFFSQFCKHG
jgi:hypothetical protein